MNQNEARLSLVLWKLKNTLFSILLQQSFGPNNLFVLSVIVGKQAILNITGGRINGTNFNPGNLILSINITGAHTLYLSAFASKNLSYRYTHTGAEWYMHKASHCFVVSKAKVENNLSVYQ